MSNFTLKEILFFYCEIIKTINSLNCNVSKNDKAGFQLICASASAVSVI